MGKEKIQNRYEENKTDTKQKIQNESYYNNSNDNYDNITIIITIIKKNNTIIVINMNNNNNNNDPNTPYHSVPQAARIAPWRARNRP